MAITFDVMPTLIELAGGRIPDGHRLDGVSLVSVLTGNEMTARNPARRTLFGALGAGGLPWAWRLETGGRSPAR
ncbi:MAG: hypothetical protein CM1200mP2_06240 [Planctomycetaceae bacterium]|nr:MAG: hypothetical protein CM1200mP2_06240 [Planctomycetaceae bacterium]